MSPIVRIETFVYEAPSPSPVRTSFGTMTTRPAVFVRLEDSDGAQGWGEIWCNFPPGAAEYRGKLFHDAVAPQLLGRGPSSPQELFVELEGRLSTLAVQCGEPGPLGAALAGADAALWDLAARKAGVSLSSFLDASAKDRVAVYASGINPEGAGRTIEAAREDGFSAFKVKIGFGMQDDLSVVRGAAACLLAGEELMVDANQAWDLETASRMVAALAEAPLSWVEEPIRADRPLEEWSSLEAESPLRLAGGENLRGPDFDVALSSRYLAVLQPDICKWGGISAVAPIARAASEVGLVYCPHFLGGAIGLLGSAHLLAAVGGTGRLEVDVNRNPLREEVLAGELQAKEGVAALPEGTGLGVTPDPSSLRRFLSLHLDRRL